MTTDPGNLPEPHAVTRGPSPRGFHGTGARPACTPLCHSDRPRAARSDPREGVVLRAPSVQELSDRAHPCACPECFTRFCRDTGPPPSSTAHPALASTGSGSQGEGEGSWGKQHGREERGKSLAGTEPTLLSGAAGVSGARSLREPGVPLAVASVSRCYLSLPALPLRPDHTPVDATDSHPAHGCGRECMNHALAFP